MNSSVLYRCIEEIHEFLRKMDKYESYENVKHVWHDDEAYISLSDLKACIIDITHQHINNLSFN